MFFRQSFQFFSLFVLVACIGCGEPQIKAHGVVQFEDGTPLNCGVVVFATPQLQYTGKIEQDGTFQLGGLVEKGGLPIGSYKVSIQNAIMNDKPMIPAKYTSDVTSGISFEVVKESAKESLTIILEKK